MLDLPIPSDTSAVVRTLAHEYDDAPALHPSRAVRGYFQRYGEWVKERAAYLKSIYNIKECRFEAYSGGTDLRQDAQSGRLVVTRDYADHPLFDLETNQAIRIVHDLDGHASTGMGFSWAEEVAALREQARRTPPQWLPALFAQTLHQLASTTHNKRFPDQQKLVVSQHGEWRTTLLGTTRALTPPVGQSHDDCCDCDVPHPHMHMKEEA